MFELSDIYFKVAIMKLLQPAIKNAFQTNEEKKSLIRDIKFVREQKKRCKEDPQRKF
jgi:hypothetical protein